MKSSSSSVFIGSAFQAFKTHGDSILEKMRSSAVDFVREVSSRSEPRWLSFVGNSGTGKTFLATAIYKDCFNFQHIQYHKSLLCGCIRAYWPHFLGLLRNGEHWRLGDAADCNLLLLDELAIEHDPSGFAADKLCELLSRRVGKWTLITTNLTLAKLESIDERIASRMIRGKSVVVGCNTVDYATRHNNVDKL